jgi:hypothetical protein
VPEAAVSNRSKAGPYSIASLVRASSVGEKAGQELWPEPCHRNSQSREQYVVVCARSLAFQSRSAWHAPSISRKLPRKWPNLTGWWLSIPRRSWISFTTYFPGGLIPNHALNGTGEWAWGITDWWEMGFYTPYAVDQDLTPYSNAAKIRQLFVIPNAAEREFFYGVNFEFSYAMPQFSETRWNMEIRPIVGWRKGDYEFIINPIVDLGFGQSGGAEFVPAARFARKLGASERI